MFNFPYKLYTVLKIYFIELQSLPGCAMQCFPSMASGPMGYAKCLGTCMATNIPLACITDCGMSFSCIGKCFLVDQNTLSATGWESIFFISIKIIYCSTRYMQCMRRWGSGMHYPWLLRWLVMFGKMCAINGIGSDCICRMYCSMHVNWHK